jgi:hypothetical protein
MPRGGRRCDLGGRGQRPRPRTSSGGDCVSTFDDALEQAKQAQDIRDQEERDYRARQRAEREAGEEAVSRFLQLVSEGRDKIEPRWFQTVSWPREGSRPDVVSRPEGTSGKHGWVTRRSRAPEPSGNQMAQMSSVRGWVVHSSDDVSEGGSLSWHLMIVTPDGQLLSVGGSGSTSPPEDDPIVVGGPPVDLGQRNQWWKVPEYLAATAVAMGIFPPSR